MLRFIALFTDFLVSFGHTQTRPFNVLRLSRTRSHPQQLFFVSLLLRNPSQERWDEATPFIYQGVTRDLISGL